MDLQIYTHLSNLAEIGQNIKKLQSFETNLQAATALGFFF